MDLAATTENLKKRGIKGRMVAHKGSLYWRGTYTTADGCRKDRRLHLGLTAHPGQLLEAEKRVMELASAVADSGFLPDPLPWAKEKNLDGNADGQPQGPRTVAEASSLLEQDFWQGKVRSSAAERTWERVQGELKRLPAQASLTIELLVAVANTTNAGSRTRLEACKVFKRLGKLAGLDSLDQLDAIRTPYEPGERNLPTEGELLELLKRTRGHHKYGWVTAALVVFGCRPSEVFSLQPAADGTARVLSVKRKGKLPSWRTALALPPEWAKRFELMDVSKPWDITSPSQYDSAEARRITQAWGVWLKAQAQGQQLYNCRHAWAVRSIHQGINASLAAKTMGHSLAVHHSTYHRWLDQADVAAVALALRANKQTSIK